MTRLFFAKRDRTKPAEKRLSVLVGRHRGVAGVRPWARRYFS